MTTTTAAAPPAAAFLATRRGKLTLALLCAVAFLDFIDASIVNIALPSIRDDLGVSVQNLQWIPSGYLLTYGGFMLLGGRARRPARAPAGARRRHRDHRALVARRRLRRQSAACSSARAWRRVSAPR